MEETLRVHKFDELPSQADFESQIESRNVPAIFNGCIKGWEAMSKWNPRNGGLNYLQEGVGNAVVEAMLSRSAPVFYGDLRGPEMVPLPFSTFITSCKQRLTNSKDDCGACVESENHGVMGHTADESCLASPHQVYLAQVPILNLKNKERSQLETLREDIQMPTVLERMPLASINLWMNNAKSRSSSHYDPHHNLLCVIAGGKQVVLWPPSASSLLYPIPIYGEASNHSSVDLENPDYSIHSRAKQSIVYSQKVTLHAGDALFIPEGWFHQVDSDDLTIAVNYWWQSDIMSSMLEHMDAYYLCRILRRLVNKEMLNMKRKKSSAPSLELRNWLLKPHRIGNVEFCFSSPGQDECGLDKKCGTKDLVGTNQKQKIMMHQLDPHAVQALHKLVSLVHDNVDSGAQSKPLQYTLTDGSADHVRGDCRKITRLNSFCLEDDPVAKILCTLEPNELQNVLLAMVHNFPRTMEALILHMLSPVGAEILTRKFDEMDQLITKEERNEFYQVFYGVFDDQFAAMEAILNGKESFVFQVFQNVLDKYLGVKFDE